MTKKKRYDLREYHFHELTAVIYDNLEEKELRLNLYEIINLLNEATQENYNKQQMVKEIKNRLDELESMGQSKDFV